jgi:hypothetical protein
MHHLSWLLWFGVCCSILLIGSVISMGRKHAVTFILLTISVASILFIATEMAPLSVTSPTIVIKVDSPGILVNMLVGAFLFMIIGTLFLLATARRRHHTAIMLKPKGASHCLECGQRQEQRQSLRSYSYTTSSGMALVGRLCTDCAGKHLAVPL